MVIAIEISALLAIIAGMTTDIVINDDFIADLNIFNIFSNFFDRPENS